MTKIVATGLTRPSLGASALVLGLTAITLTAGTACDGGDEGHGGHTAAIGKVGKVPLPPPEKPAIDLDALRKRASKHFGVLPTSFPNPENPLSTAKIDLGRMLYYETRLSKANDISCNSCHLLDVFGVDGNPTSPGHKGALGDRNSPTVYNAAGHLAQFWDGRAATVEEQAKGPILNPVEMAMPDEATVEAVLAGIPGYVSAFDEAFPEPEGKDDPALTYEHMAMAIGAFERKLVTPAPIDAWLGGEDAALSEQAVEGMALFLDTDCQNCHSGYNFGGTSYQKLGSEKPWPGLKDEGRIVITADPRDSFTFKVPSLRNIDKTGPYLHDGSIEKLPDMVAKMVEHQTKRGAAFNEAEMDQMLAFLGALTGEPSADYIAKPELPADGPEPEPPSEGSDTPDPA